MTAGERLQQILDMLQLSQTSLAEQYGAPSQYVNDVIHGRRKLREDFLAWLHERHAVNISWLVSGKGPPILDTDSADRISENEQVYRRASHERLLHELGMRLHTTEQSHPLQVGFVENADRFKELEGAERYYALPFMEDPAAAGAGRIMTDEIAGYVVLHQNLGLRPDRTSCVRVCGESMMPCLPDGSIVAIDTSRRDINDLQGKVVCARTEDGGVVIKRLRLAGKRVLLHSDNPRQEEHPPVIVELAMMPDPIIGQVVWAAVNLK